MAVKVIQIECSNQNVLIYLDRALPPRHYLKRYDVVEPIKGVVSVLLPGIKGSQEIYDCFKPDDLQILKDGTISILSDKPMFIRYLGNPPKISLITKRFTTE